MIKTIIIDVTFMTPSVVNPLLKKLQTIKAEQQMMIQSL